MPDPTQPRLAPTITAGGTAAPAARCARCAAGPASIDTATDGPVCRDCAARYHTRCPGCHQYYADDADCPDCLVCDHCDALVPEDDTTDTVRGATICEDCRADFHWQCPACQGWNHDGDDCGNGCCDPDDCDCDDCYSEPWSARVHDYDYKPVPVFHGDGPLFLGPEIEVETPYARTEECAAIAQSYLGALGYLKTDGSLANGFEIVTHPMSYPWAMAHFPWPMLPELARRGAMATEATGLHVHVSRAGFTSSCHTYRWMKFIHRNQRQVQALARRSSPSWAAFTAADRRAVKDYAKGARSDRYRAINTGNRDTFELRIFASSLNPAQVQAALGFAAASIQYTAGLSVPAIAGRGGWGWPAFTAWLTDRPAYTPLRQQLEELSCAC